MEAKKVLGSFGPKEHGALRLVNISNGSRLNWVLEQMGVSYSPRPLPGSESSHAAIKKWKAEVLKKPAAKRAKAGFRLRHGVEDGAAASTKIRAG
jgi:hypothetical protein